MHSQFRIPRKQQRRVPAVRPVHSPLYRSLFLGIVLGAALPVAAQTVDAVRVEGGASTEGLPVDASHHAPAELIVSGNVTLRGGDVVADTDNTYAVPRQDQTVTGGSAALSAAQNMSVAGSMVLSGGQATALSDYQDYEVPDRGAARGAGGATTARIGGSLAVGTDLVVRTALVSAFSFDGPYASARAGAASLEVGRNLSVGGDFVIDATPVGAMLVSSSSGAALALREAIQVTVGGDASVAGRLELFGGQALAENQSSEDVLASARWRPVTLDVGGKLAVAGDTTLHGTDANVIRMGDARAVGDGRASDAGVMRIRVTGDSVIGGGLALQAGSADIMNTRSASDTAQATGQSVQYVAQGDLRVAQGITLQAGSAKVGRPGRDIRFNGVAKGGNSSLQASANVTSDGPVSVLAGTHYVAARPAVLQFRETAMLAFRETAIDAPAYAAAGSATLSVAGTLYIRHQDGLVVAGEPGAALPGNAIAGSPYGQAVFAAGVLRSPAATFSDASRVSIGTLDLRDTSTQLTFDNTQPYNAATGQGVQLGQLLFGGGNALTIAGNGGFGFQGGITVLGPNAAYQGPALSANGGQLSFLLPADAVNGTTMLRASAPIATQGATVAMQAAGPLKRLLPGDRITLISATTGTVANPGSHILEYGAYRYLFDVQSASALTATLASTNLTLAANKLYPRSIGAGIGALADSGGMLSAADLRGPERRGLFFSPDLGHTRYTDKNIKLDRANAVFGYALGGATAAGDYVVAPLVEAGRTRYRGQASSGGLSAEGKGRVDNVGVGILARYWFLGGTYAEASLRSGRMRGSYTDDIDGSTNYRSRSNYWGAHAMLGHVMPLSERGQLDAYARLQWQRLGGDSVRNDAGDQLSYDATQALRTRLGARYVYAAGDQTRLYAGAAWEQDARTEVRARLDGKALQGADTNGGATVLEAGARWEPSPSWSLRLSAQGQFGARQGIGGEAFVYRRF